MAALLTRALYVRGRPAVAGGLVAAGWLIAAIVPLAVLPDDAGPRDTLLLLGVSSSCGMTVAAGGLFAAVRRTWGVKAFRGFGRTAAAALGAATCSAVVARRLGDSLSPHGLVGAALVAVLAAIVAVTLGAVLIWVADRESTQLTLTKLRRRPR
jgi:putative peptidoglycan lipid II flippase